MSKRAHKKFTRKDRDSYDTPPSAVGPLLRVLEPADGHGKVWFYEPCAGAGKLTDALVKSGKCVLVGETDIEPRATTVGKLDGKWLREGDVGRATHIITNPPWDREVLHHLIDRFSSLRPTWLLLDAGWMHTKQARPYLEYCLKIVSIGRVSWEQNGVHGFDDCAWYLFDQNNPSFTVFIGR